MRGVIRAAALAMFALFVASRLAAQESGNAAVSRAADARVKAALDRFVRTANHAERLKAIIDSTRNANAAAPAADSIVGGAIVVRFRGEPPPSGLRARTADAVASASATAAKTLGDQIRLVTGHPLNLVRARFNFFEAEPYVTLNFPGKNVRWHQFRTAPTSEQLTDAILDLYGSLVGGQAPPALRAWSGRGWLSLKPNLHEEWEQAGVALATSRSSFGRRCYEGALADCAIALELNADQPADPLYAWYRPDDFPELVSEYTTTDSAEGALFHLCVTERHTDVCEAAVRRRAARYPLGVSIKDGLVAYAVERGGAGAFGRLMGTTGPVSSILAATAGIPLDELLGEWRANAVAATPAKSLPGPLEGVTILVWTVAFGALATRRRP
jgi:hypothetical protein